MEQTHNGINYKFFWGGVFSNWYPSQFEKTGITYNCAEQFMMHQKALLFKDYESATKIMKEKSPRVQKQYGREVKNFDKVLWESVCYDIVKDGLREKFLQNPELKDYLLKYKDYQIVEASPEDRIWGIGYKDVDAINNIDDWGTNFLGKILTELAQEIFKNNSTLPTKWSRTKEIETWIGDLSKGEGGRARLIVTHYCGDNNKELIGQLKSLIYGLENGFDSFGC